MNIKLTKPSLKIPNTQALLNNQGISYNEAGVSYNQAGITYGGVYGPRDLGPSQSRITNIRPS